MQKHIPNTCQSSYMHIRKINSIRRYLSEQATVTLINSTVLIRLDYCNSVYVGLPQTSLHKLELAQNTAARVASCRVVSPHYAYNATVQLASNCTKMSTEITCIDI